VRALVRLLRGLGGRRRSRPARGGATLAAAAAAEGGPEVTAGAIQAHGGIGFTWEADIHWLYKRAQMDTALLGGARRHRAALARRAANRILAIGAGAG
jgi:alkylation response protein AidB-like acyl-CoA dehydrogenase